MRVLLDTHALLWFLNGSAVLPVSMRKMIASPDHAVLVSAASGWEIATKHRIGKLPSAAGFVGQMSAKLKLHGFSELPISLTQAELAGRLEGAHRDPFDRMLIAQAKTENLALISNEKLFDSFGVARLW